MKIFLVFYLISTSLMSQNKLPFKTIPGAPDNITTGTSLARMTQGIGFRYYWATEGLSAEDLKYRPSEEAQSMLETIKLKLVKLLINSIWKYNSDECPEKWMETTIDDIKFLIE